MAKWYYAIGDEQQGPVEQSEISNLIAQGSINAKCRVWRSGMPDWVALEMTELAGLLPYHSSNNPLIAPESNHPANPYPGQSNIPAPQARYPSGSAPAPAANPVSSLYAQGGTMPPQGPTGPHNPYNQLVVPVVKNSLATAGFVVGIVSIFINLYGLTGIVGICLSIAGLSKASEIKKDCKEAGYLGAKAGMGYAIAGLILSLVSIVGSLFLLLYLFG
ncbi:MAG: DUF4339 domain-containing protein [Planctomycetes bacterium]|nr:DUF4339 domain-containing protein [Planctomycetota bacterium]